MKAFFKRHQKDISKPLVTEIKGDVLVFPLNFIFHFEGLLE